jgi:hypothetical protein
MFTVKEAAALTGWSRQTVVRRFEREPGVLILTVRGHRLITIPRAVLTRVLGKESNGGVVAIKYQRKAK